MSPLCNTNAEMVPVSTVWWIVIAAVMTTLVISWIIFHHFLFNKKAYPKFCQRMEYHIEALENTVLSHWYTILLIACSIYVFIHFEKCMNLKFTSDFNGYNVIFIFWLILLIIPLFEKIEGFGIGFKTRRQARELDALYIATKKATNKEQILGAEELEKSYKKGGQDE